MPPGAMEGVFMVLFICFSAFGVGNNEEQVHSQGKKQKRYKKV